MRLADVVPLGSSGVEPGGFGPGTGLAGPAGVSGGGAARSGCVVFGSGAGPTGESSGAFASPMASGLTCGGAARTSGLSSGWTVSGLGARRSLPATGPNVASAWPCSVLGASASFFGASPCGSGNPESAGADWSGGGIAGPGDGTFAGADAGDKPGAGTPGCGEDVCGGGPGLGEAVAGRPAPAGLFAGSCDGGVGGRIPRIVPAGQLHFLAGPRRARCRRLTDGRQWQRDGRRGSRRQVRLGAREQGKRRTRAARVRGRGRRRFRRSGRRRRGGGRLARRGLGDERGHRSVGEGRRRRDGLLLRRRGIDRRRRLTRRAPRSPARHQRPSGPPRWPCRVGVPGPWPRPASGSSFFPSLVSVAGAGSAFARAV